MNFAGNRCQCFIGDNYNEIGGMDEEKRGGAVSSTSDTQLREPRLHC